MSGADGVGGRRYWRSLETRRDAEAADGRLPERLRPEFAEGADRPPDGVTRRTVLGLMGASVAMATTACQPEHDIVPYVDAPENVTPGVAKHYASTFALGASARGVVVESHEGRPTKIEGNPRHPSSRGAADVWTQAAVLHLYDPDRLPAPQRRPGAEGGEGGWEAAAWGDFVTWWTETAQRLSAAETGEGGGGGLAVISGAHASPTLDRLHGELAARYPRLRWAVHEPVADDAVHAGLAAATGAPRRPVYRLQRARVIAALDADLLLTESEAVASTRGFAAGRDPDGAMNRLYAVEPTPTVTGGAADHRVQLPAGQVGAFAAAVAGELGVDAGVAGAAAAAAALPAGVREKAAALARDLEAAGNAALVAAGRRQPPAVHALVHAVNAALGAVGNTVTYAEPPAGAAGDVTLAELAAAMRNGEVDTLVVLGANPVYSAPADLDLAAALDEVPHVVQLAHARDETSEHADWVLPQAGWLEAWGDARAADGTLSVVQPLIAPLLDGRSAVELVALMAGGEERDGLSVVRETWDDVLGEGLSIDGDRETRWRRVLHDGVLEGAALGETVEVADTPAATGEPPAPAPAADLRLTASAPTPDVFELALAPAPGPYDGRFANVAWLQEMPDPVTKLTWDNGVQMAPADARRLGVEDGDVVRLTVGDGGSARSVEAPVLVQPGQAAGSLGLTLGYGRRRAGRVGDGVGVDAYPLRTTAAPWIVSGVRVEATGEHRKLARTQEHHSMEGRGLVREATRDEYRERPEFAGQHQLDADAGRIFAGPPLDGAYRWGMTIDLAACTGCNACVVACQAENNVPVVGREQVRRGRELLWLRVDRYYAGGEDDPRMVFQPVPCMHCENAPCEQVCPVAATVHDAEGINTMVYNRCIGTRYCSNNCPYKVRRFNYFNFTNRTPEIVKLAMNPDVTVRSRGVMEKCTYCLQRVNEAKATAKRQGRRVGDGDVVTACQQTCPADAIAFGDLADEESRVAREKRSPRNYVLLGELRNLPRTSYLARVTNPNPDWPGFEPPAAGHGGDAHGGEDHA